MPCYGLLGIEICVPSVDDIVNAVLQPINSYIWSAVQWVSDTLSPLFSGVVSSLSPLFDTVYNNVVGFLNDPLGTIQNALGGVSSALSSLPNFISGGLDTLGSGITGALDATGAALTGAISSAEEFLSGALSSVEAGLGDLLTTVETTLSGAVDLAAAGVSQLVEEVGNGLGLAFQFVQDSLGGIISSVFQGFGFANVGEIVGSAVGAEAQLLTALISLPAGHSPLEPSETQSWASGFIDQVEAACVTLHISNIVAEAASLGQIDISLQEAWRYPYTAAAMSVAQTLAAMPLLEGFGPAFKRYILRSYQPNIPDFQSLISIYVKEGYLEEHWVEIPDEMVNNFAELGFNAEWTKRLWGMHWQYPGPSQLYEMLHRTAGNFPEIGVTDEILRDMLKLHDYEPKWRTPLELISWNTWRIFDIRAGWEIDVLDNDGLKKRLIDTGYLPADAELLANIQKMYVLRSEIDGLLTESDTDFMNGWIDEDQLRANYDATPYNADVKELRMARARLRRDRTDKADIKTALANRFYKGDLSEAEFTDALSRLGVIQSRIDVEIEKVKVKRLQTVKEDTATTGKALTEATYSRAFKVGLIAEEIYRANLAALKYTAEDIGLLVELNTPERPSPDVVKTLTVAELKAAFRVAVLSEEDLRAELAARKYSDVDIDTIVATEQKKIKPAAAEAVA